MTRIRLNQEYRNKIANRMRVHLEQEDTQEKQKYDTLKTEQIDLNDNAWKVAEQIVRPGISSSCTKIRMTNPINNTTTSCPVELIF